MASEPIPADYRVVQLIQRDPPDEVLRQADMIPGEAGRYARVIRYRHDLSRTVYEVLQFKAGRPPTREEVVADLLGDLARVDTELKELETVGHFGAWVDRKLFSGFSPEQLRAKRKEIQETIETIEQEYAPGEAVCVP